MKFHPSTTSTTALYLLSSLPTSYAWGSLGHETVAYVASNFVSSDTTSFFQTILHNQTDSYLAGVATWADSFRYTAAGRFSAPFHFIDAEDDPPTSCGVKYSRDCPVEGCIVGAILNYTTQLLDPDLDAVNRNIAAKFVIHFIGDIHQPLHDENLDRGGNSILVTFDNVQTNLHHVWDSNIPEKLVGGYSLPDAEKWATALTAAIKTGVYKTDADSWLEGVDLRDPVSTSIKWAEEANQFVCQAVLPEGKDAIVGKELGGAYYEAAVPVIELQVARAGYRLAQWLDLIAAGGKTEL
ncbi:Nuclease S1 [Lachnellula hyalina]|uniref:Nuclease S1 n=1 Tax=Lachnellula hyalina TaxID=1316788 RepID=A0A8H8QW79_9HELO|nr:Nuclease S1 [Lachnellula hyalina]TVY23671.1 Nuclease S1 [Lachnellula hyalina]